MLTIFPGIQRRQKEKKELAQNSEEWTGLAVKICEVFCPEEKASEGVCISYHNWAIISPTCLACLLVNYLSGEVVFWPDD